MFKVPEAEIIVHILPTGTREGFAIFTVLSSIYTKYFKKNNKKDKEIKMDFL